MGFEKLMFAFADQPELLHAINRDLLAFNLGLLERLLPLMKTGGFIPSVDHQTPPGVSLDQYRLYLRLLNEYTSPTRSV